VLDMDADELLLRRRVHQAYDTRALRGPSPAWVSERVRARVAETARRQRRTAGTVAVGAGLLLVSIVGIQIDQTKTISVPLAQDTTTGGSGGNSAAQEQSGGPAASGNTVHAPSNMGMEPSVVPEQRAAAPVLKPCPRQALKVVVTPDQQSYGQGDVATITTTVVNLSATPCRSPQVPAVWISGADGRRWRLCPEPDAPPSQPGAPAAEPADHPPAPQPAASTFFGPGAVATADCIWHTAYSGVAQGTYVARASWDGASAATTLSVALPAG